MIISIDTEQCDEEDLESLAEMFSERGRRLLKTADGLPVEACRRCEEKAGVEFDLAARCREELNRRKLQRMARLVRLRLQAHIRAANMTQDCA